MSSIVFKYHPRIFYCEIKFNFFTIYLQYRDQKSEGSLEIIRLNYILDLLTLFSFYILLWSMFFLFYFDLLSYILTL